MVIARQVGPKIARHVEVVRVATGRIFLIHRIAAHPIPRWEVVEVHEAVAVPDLAATQSRVGLKQARRWFILPSKCEHSLPSEKTWKSGHLFLTFVTFFCVTRGGAAKELHDFLEEAGVSVWFSEKDVLLGSNLLREIDKGLVKSRVGIVLVTPALLRRLQSEGIADKELSALLARDLLVPIVHETTYEELREVSPLLGSRSGLSTAEDSMTNVAAKLAELVAL